MVRSSGRIRNSSGIEKARAKVTWDKMKWELRRKYLPKDYKQDVYLQIQGLR